MSISGFKKLKKWQINDEQYEFIASVFLKYDDDFEILQTLHDNGFSILHVFQAIDDSPFKGIPGFHLKKSTIRGIIDHTDNNAWSSQRDYDVLRALHASKQKLINLKLFFYSSHVTRNIVYRVCSFYNNLFCYKEIQ